MGSSTISPSDLGSPTSPVYILDPLVIRSVCEEYISYINNDCHLAEGLGAVPAE